MIALPRRPPTSSTTWRCCCGGGGFRWPTPNACSMAVASPDTALTGIQPSLETARSLARDHNLIPVHQTFIDDCQTPVSAYLKLRQQPGNWHVTRSGEGARGMRGPSFL